jgi:uncharacterized protein with HEPN domain
MSKRTDAALLGDIREAIRRIEAYTRHRTYPQFLKNTQTQDAVVRNLEILGEAVKGLSPEAKQRYRDIEWTKIAGMRDKLIHHYFGVNWDIVWAVIHEELPVLKKRFGSRRAATKKGWYRVAEDETVDWESVKKKLDQ